jgi:hypothetical protein
MMGRPMLPTAAVLSPAAARIDSSICVVVVLPLVPVIPSQGTILSGRLSRQASSTSLQMGTPRAAAWTSSGELAGQPVAITRSTSSGRFAVAPGPSRTKPPSTSSSLPLSEVRSSSRSSRIVTRAPKCSSPSPAANPETPIPATTTCACGHGDRLSAWVNQEGVTRASRDQTEVRFRAQRHKRTAPGPDRGAFPRTTPQTHRPETRPRCISAYNMTKRSCTGHPLGVEDAQTGGHAEPGDDPKAHHNGHLRPVEQFEVMVNGRHLEQPPATSQLEEADLEDH